MNLQIINPLQYPGWDDLLLTNDKSSFFHSASWAQVLIEAYGYKPVYFTSIDNGNLSALIPVMEVTSFITGKRGVSLPFTDMCPPIVSDSEFFSEASEAIKEHGRENGWKSMEWRGVENHFRDKTPSSSYYVHTLDLGGTEEQAFLKFRDSTKRNIKKAIIEGVQVGSHNSLESVKQFYHMNCITRKRHGLPPQPFYFFKRIYERIIFPKKGFVMLATHSKRTIAAAVYFLSRNEVIYKYGASDSAFQHLRANNLVMWEAIRRCIKNRIKTFNFGVTEVENQGLRRFKNGWSPREEMAHYYKYSLKDDAFEKSGFRRRTCYALFKKMPSPLLNLIGFLLYRHVG